MIVHNAHQEPMPYVGIDCFKCERGVSIQLKCKMSKFILTASGLHLGRFTIISRVVCIRAAGHVAIFFITNNFVNLADLEVDFCSLPLQVSIIQ